jgi:hypothetical protein
MAVALRRGNDPKLIELPAAERLDLTFEICTRLFDEAEEERAVLLGALGI